MPSLESVYLDTSILSAYFDNRDEGRRLETKRFFDKLLRENVYVSELVLEELELISNPQLRREVLQFARKFRTLEISEKANELAEEYVEENIFPEKYFSDALHLAIATIGKINVLVSWNFEHIVKRKTKISVNLVNTLKGYHTIDIASPLDF